MALLTQLTVARLREMKLEGMAQALLGQLGRPDVQALGFEERLGLLVDHEWTHRQDKRVRRLLADAKLRLPASVEDIDYHHPRGLDRSVMAALGMGHWISRGHNVLITGPTGTGKTFLACALGNAACRQGFRVRYHRVPRLVQELALARADGSYPRLLGRLQRLELLILDDWGIAPLAAAEARDLLEVIEDRAAGKSTLVSSQLPVQDWHAALSDPTVADAILDRLVHNAYKITLRGESMRKVMGAEKPIDHSTER